MGPQIRFQEATSTRLSVLEIITQGRRSVLARVRRLLFDLRVQIVRVESLVGDKALEERFFVVELDGARIQRRRAAAIRSAVRRTLKQPGASDAAA